ncbi:TraR/DksA C4-type zinc finger protein [Vannielia litorea]|uniref:TraR/DksA family transcriptional regulator n=1 Tax=Vannielia litorea TaxID=1217970 RepID=UPI001C93D9B0|nr:TraR/DksA C4-type zinc finger protein [Vannielia litorea]MBY6046686.1 TraR/DksA C4-type zinc finger protein [Vannielia litorea]MBY6074100.1 TraR/DksA C4-type zinc finger protein [Vannielia litorea]MBY6153406.1 TraR/DksA C4-type zinc finger protein [Vannielia litorea]
MTDVNARKAALEKRLAELDTRLHEIQDELVSHNSADWEELATEREEDEVLEGQGVKGQAEMAAIRAALARIEAGEYGFCTQCGTEISAARLDLLPQTPFCKACAP